MHIGQFYITFIYIAHFTSSYLIKIRPISCEKNISFLFITQQALKYIEQCNIQQPVDPFGCIDFNAKFNNFFFAVILIV